MAQPVRRGMGKPGFPIPPPGGRVWEGCALPRSMFIPVGVRREPHGRLMKIKHIIRYAPRAVGLKPSAMRGNARLRGLYRMKCLKIISPRL